MTEVERLERQQFHAKQGVERREKLERLMRNTDFKELILDGFCRDECTRYVQESGDPLLEPHQREDALNMAQASGHLRRFLSLIYTMGNQAENTLRDLDDEIEAARVEEAAAEVEGAE